jgi:hypothetical protein
MSEMIREDLGEGKVMNRKGVGSEESAIERKDDESPFLGRFLYWTFVGKGFTIVFGTGWSKHFWMVVHAFWIASRPRVKEA